MKSPHEIIIAPLLSEKSLSLARGDMRIQDERQIVRKYTFYVSPDANKIQIKQAIEEIYNAGKKKADHIVVERVHTVRVVGKQRRVRTKASVYPKVGYTPDRKKAIVTLAKGQILEDYGV